MTYYSLLALKRLVKRANANPLERVMNAPPVNPRPGLNLRPQPASGLPAKRLGGPESIPSAVKQREVFERFIQDPKLIKTVKYVNKEMTPIFQKYMDEARQTGGNPFSPEIFQRMIQDPDVQKITERVNHKMMPVFEKYRSELGPWGDVQMPLTLKKNI